MRLSLALIIVALMAGCGKPKATYPLDDGSFRALPVGGVDDTGSVTMFDVSKCKVGQIIVSDGDKPKCVDPPVVGSETTWHYEKGFTCNSGDKVWQARVGDDGSVNCDISDAPK